MEEYTAQYVEKFKAYERDRVKKYYQENKEKVLAYHKQYYEQNKDKVKEQKKAYYEQNKDKLNEANKQYREQNKEAIKEKRKEYYKQYDLNKTLVNFDNIPNDLASEFMSTIKK